MARKKTVRGLSVRELSYRIDPAFLDTLQAELAPMGIIGQPRGMQALRMGIELWAPGYNIFVSGLSGTGRRTAINKLLKEYSPAVSRLKDIVFVFNYSAPDSPSVLFFKPGKARRFKRQMHRFVEDLKETIKAVMDSEDFRKQRDAMVAAIEAHENDTLMAYEGRVTESGFKVVQINEGETQSTDLVPVVDGAQTTFDELQNKASQGTMDRESYNLLRENYSRYVDEMKRLFRDLRKERAKMDDEVKNLQVKLVRPKVQSEIEHHFEEFKEKETRDYLEAVEEDVCENLYLFLSETPQKDRFGNPSLIRYGVNIVVDHLKTKGFPIVNEDHPSYTNLFGGVEANVDAKGEARLSFMIIKAGSLVQASGGFLILAAEDLLAEEDSWTALKRALKSGKVAIQHHPGPMYNGGPLLKPAPIDIDVKVVIIGNEFLYGLLYSQDTDFQKYFKISAEFDSVMVRNDHNTKEYISFIQKIVTKEKLRPVSPDGTCAIIEYGIRVAEERDRLSTRFSLIADIIRETDYWAEKMGRKAIDRETVNRAIKERRYIFNLPEEKIDEQIGNGSILIEVTGKAVGKINGLAVHDRGYYSFGRPSLITARAAPGVDGIVHIDREAGLSGQIHDKGVLILQGYLNTRFAMDFVLSMNASICFEQSYGPIEGDSASSTEIYALLSAITDIPLRQDVAVTGSVNQMGRIQPIGGVTEKVEGFFEVCRKSGLTGEQGVLIPRQNVTNLFINEEILDAVEKGRFHIWPLATIDEGLEILTGMEAGERAADGSFPEGTFNHAVQQRLRELSELSTLYKLTLKKSKHAGT